ncbi:MAG: hypothetical protein M3Y91_14645 [Actinomycetota bacterium]|nr:hypothetical protein [Actinomycetota bacterium]
MTAKSIPSTTVPASSTSTAADTTTGPATGGVPTSTVQSLPATSEQTAAPATTTVPAGNFGSVNRTDPTAVAEAVLEANFGSNTTTDTSPFDAVKRSLIWYTPAGAAQVLASAPTGPAGAEWTTWTQHKVTATVTVQVNHDSGAPPDTPTASYRQFNVLVTPHGADGWTSPPDQYQCFVTLTTPGPGSPWQVATIQTQ